MIIGSVILPSKKSSSISSFCKSLIFLIDNFFIDFLEIISISSKEIRLFPFNGKDFAFLINAFDLEP